MKEQQAAIPVIQHSELRGMEYCRGCGSEKNVKGYEFRTSSTTTQAIAWCNDCARTVAVFLLRPERSKS